MNKVSKLKHYHPEQEALEVESSLTRITSATSAIEIRTRFLRDQKMADIDDSTRAIPRTIEQGFASFKEQADQYFSHMALAFDRTMGEAARQKAEEALRLQTGIYHMLEEYLYRPPPMPSPYLLCAVGHEASRSVSPIGSPGIPVSPFVEVGLEQVFAAVGIQPSPAPGQPEPSIAHISEDLELVLRHTYEMEESALARVHYLMRDPRFLSWLDTDINCAQGDMLLINGYFENYAIRSISPLSVFAAFLVSGVLSQAQARNSVVLHHFCTLHTDPRSDELAGPRGLLRRLIAQLLTHLVRLDVHGALLDRELLHDGGPEGFHDLNALVELFGRLLEEVPEGVSLFVILDNVSDFETSMYGWNEEMDFVVGRLRSIGRPRSAGERLGLAPGLRGNVRVLMTCGMKSVEIFRWVEGRCISLEAGNE